WSRPSRPLECDHRTPPVAGFLLKRKETAIPTPRLPYRAGCDLVTRRALLYTGRPTTSRTKDARNEEGHPSRLPYDHGGHDGRNDVPDPFDLRFRGRNAHSRHRSEDPPGVDRRQPAPCRPRRPGLAVQ